MTRPNSTGQPTSIEIQLYLTAVIEVDAIKQQIAVSGYLRQWWSDDRLKYDGIGDGGCFNKMAVPLPMHNRIWQPDLYFDNAFREEYGEALLYVYPTGAVWKSARIAHVFHCKMDYTWMPFDRQTCTLEGASYAEDATQIELQLRSGDQGVVQDPEWKGRPDWDLQDVGASLADRWFGSDRWSFAYLTFTLRRRAFYYFQHVVCTALLFVMISWTGFFISNKVAPARVALGVIPVLIQLNLSNAINAKLPVISYITFLTSFLTTALIFSVVPVVQYAVVAFLLQREALRKEKFDAMLSVGSSLSKKTDGTVPQDEALVFQKSPVPAMDVKGASNNGQTEEEAVEEGEGGDLEGKAPDSGLRSRIRSAKVAPAPEPKPALQRSKTCGVTVEDALDMLTVLEKHPVVAAMLHEFDLDKSGAISLAEFRRALRGFGLYYSLSEAREIFQKLGIEDGEDMSVRQFEAFLTNPKKYMPPKGTKKAFPDQPPPEQMDIVCRYVFLISFGTVTLIYLIVGASMV